MLNVRLRFGAEPLLGARHQRGIAGQEVIHRLRRRQPGDRRHHAEGVAGQHDDVARLPAAQRQLDVRDVLDRVGRARVLGQRLVGEVQPAMRVGDDILQHRAEAVAGGPDLGLGLRRQVDHLGVAAAFEVEHAALAPAVLVVADQPAMRVGGQRRLAGAGQAEEQRDVALAADIGAAMHRQHAAVGQDPVHHGEDRLLDLAGVLAAGDHDDPLLERQRDGGAAAHAVDRRIGLEQRRVQDDVVGLEIRQLLGLRPDEDVAREQRLPGAGGDHAHPHAMRRIGAGVQVLGEQLLPLQIGLHARLQHREFLRARGGC